MTSDLLQSEITVVQRLQTVTKLTRVKTDNVDGVADAVRAALFRLRDPEKATAMQAYMKSAMPFLGVRAGPRRKTCTTVFRDWPLTDQHHWMEAVLTLWREATYREERYAALDLVGYSRYLRFHGPECMAMYEEIIVSGAWWDFVDEIAAHHLGTLLTDFPGAIEGTMRSWSIDEDLWKRRSSIICQVLRREKTDERLLTDCILPSLERKEFFLRKAIGWALRAYSLVDADFVRDFVTAQNDRLSPLSRREALRRIESK